MLGKGEKIETIQTLLLNQMKKKVLMSLYLPLGIQLSPLLMKKFLCNDYYLCKVTEFCWMQEEANSESHFKKSYFDMVNDLIEYCFSSLRI